MLKEAKFEQVYIVCGYTDMRRSIDGLAGIVKQNFGLEPCSGSLFLFCGKRRDRMKALLWEGDGFLLMYKRLQWLFSVAEERCGGKTADSRAVYLAVAGTFNRAAEGN